MLATEPRRPGSFYLSSELQQQVFPREAAMQLDADRQSFARHSNRYRDPGESPQIQPLRMPHRVPIIFFSADSPIPYSPVLEKAAVPQVADIIAMARKLAGGGA